MTVVTDPSPRTLFPLRVLKLIIREAPVAMSRPKVDTRGARPHGYIPAKTRLAVRAIRKVAAETLAGNDPFTGAVSVTADAVIAMPKSVPAARRWREQPIKRPDIDRYLNTLLDGLSPLWKDDSQVVEARIRKVYALEGERPGWLVTVEEVQ